LQHCRSRDNLIDQQLSSHISALSQFNNTTDVCREGLSTSLITSTQLKLFLLSEIEPLTSLGLPDSRSINEGE